MYKLLGSKEIDGRKIILETYGKDLKEIKQLGKSVDNGVAYSDSEEKFCFFGDEIFAERLKDLNSLDRIQENILGSNFVLVGFDNEKGKWHYRESEILDDIQDYLSEEVNLIKGVVFYKGNVIYELEDGLLELI